MQYLRLSILSYLLFFSYLYGLAGEKDYVQYVNPLIGTQGDGHCFPGAVRPLGMVQPSPETTTDYYPGYEGDHISGYQYSDSYIWGITQTHLNGVGCPTLSDILLILRIKSYAQTFVQNIEKIRNKLILDIIRLS